MGALSRAGTVPRMAALLLVALLPEVVLPDPLSLTVAASPEVWEPAPDRPGPLPAPLSKYCPSVSGHAKDSAEWKRVRTVLAPAGMVGSAAEPSKAQSASWVGQAAALVALV